MTTTTPVIYVALPAMNERAFLPFCLESLLAQSYRNFRIVICVNQPDEYWDIKKDICENNAATIEYINQLNSSDIILIDHCSKGRGWKAGKTGIGIARKTLMDFISGTAKHQDIIISMDADTIVGKDFFQSVLSVFTDKNIIALANPYYHKLTGNKEADRAILRYEIYMRNYIINLLLINSPYAFTALGSAMGFKVSAYKAIGGMTPKTSGEDFYFLQKLKKYGNVSVYNSENVFPASRFSDRVIFGTGPAMIKGNSGDWSSYPVYHHSLFEKIQKTYTLFEALFVKNCPTPLDEFLIKQFGEYNIWDKLRLNFKNKENFVRACHEKIDGLRILQYLKIMQTSVEKSDEMCLSENIIFFRKYYDKSFENFKDIESFDNLSVEQMNNIRDSLYYMEDFLRKKQKIL